MYGELAESFHTISEVASAAAVIVVGRVVESRDAPYQRIPFTVLTVEVERGLKGPVSAGERVQVVETGGVFAGRSKAEPGQSGPPVEAAFEGVPVMKVGERWLLFLGVYDPGPVATGAYSVKGVFQGKFKVGADGRIVFTGPVDRIEEPIFTLQALLNQRSLSEVIPEIEKSVSAN